MESIIQDYKACWLCGTTQGLHDHHIFFGRANRKLSEKYGLKVWLCGYHHNLSPNSVHFYKPFDNMLKQVAQRRFEKEHSREEFMKIFGRNYL